MIEFIYGPPSSGKTVLLYEKIKETLMRGGDAVLIVPDQEALDAEAALASAQDGAYGKVAGKRCFLVERFAVFQMLPNPPNRLASGSELVGFAAPIPIVFEDDLVWIHAGQVCGERAVLPKACAEKRRFARTIHPGEHKVVRRGHQNTPFCTSSRCRC